MTTYVVHFALFAFAHYQVDRFAVVFYVKPVAHVASVTVDRQMFAFEYILDNQWNQFFGKMIGAVVVGTAGDRYRHFISVVISHDYHVGTGFRSTVRAMRTKRGFFREVAFRTE